MPSSRDEGRRDRGLLPALLVTTAATFAVSVSFPFMQWDDPRYAWKNPLVLHPLGQGWRELMTTPALGYPQGLTVLSYAAQRALFGLEPWSFHLVNLLLHLANVAQVYALGRKLALTRRLAVASSMVFALHPLVVEPVCWVTGRKDLLATALLLLAALLMLEGDRSAPFPSARRWLLVSGSAILGMWAKPSTSVAAVVLGLLAFSARPSWPKRALATALSPLLLAGGIVVWAAGAAQSSSVDVHSRTLHEAALDVLGAGALQFSHFVWPDRLVGIYARIPGDPSTPRMIATTTLMLALVVPLARGNPRSATFAGFATAILAYAPMSNVLAVNRWTADSYMYLPLVGVSIGLASSLGSTVPPRVARLMWLIIPALGLALATNAFAQTAIWSTPEAVWEAEIDRYPSLPIGFTALASTLDEDGHAALATQAYIDLDQRFPDFEWDDDKRAEARLSRGSGERARALLERGVAHGDLACSATLWSALLQERIAAESVSPALVAEAFDSVFADMQSSAVDERAWQETIEVLERSHLDGRAEKVRARVRAAPPVAGP